MNGVSECLAITRGDYTLGASPAPPLMERILSAGPGAALRRILAPLVTHLCFFGGGGGGGAALAIGGFKPGR